MVLILISTMWLKTNKLFHIEKQIMVTGVIKLFDTHKKCTYCDLGSQPGKSFQCTRKNI